MSTKSKSTKSTKPARGVGRPKAKVIWPKGRFTFLALGILNGTFDKDGNELPKEEQRMCKLTLRNHLKWDMFNKDKNGKYTVPNKNSEIVLLKDELGKPTNEAGLGRKPLIYIKRSVLAASRKAKRTAALKKAQASTVSVPVADATPAEPVTA